MIIISTMDRLHNDCITCIIDKLEYLDLLNLSETCKRFESIRSFVIFREKKHSFHNFNRKFRLKCMCHVIILIDGLDVAQKSFLWQSNKMEYILLQGFFNSFGYRILKFPFTWPFYLWKKITYRFPNFNVIEIKCPDWTSNKCYNCTPNTNTQKLTLKFIDDPLETTEYFINQIQMLYHVFKSFEKDITKIMGKKK